MNKHTRSVSLIDGHTEDRTDAEIMKALEICNSTKKGHCLNRCPYYNYSANCMQSMINDALDLINRQKAEIEKLEKIERFATKTIKKQDAEIEKLNVELVGMRGACESYKMHYDNAQAEVERLKADSDMADGYEDALVEMTKSEAIKEFAEEFEYFVLNEDPEINDLKCKDYESYLGGVNQFRLQIVKGIDNLVKEKTEVKEIENTESN